MVQRNFIQRGGFCGERFMPARDFGRSDRQAASAGKGRRVQRLANVANRLLPTGMPVQKTAARGKVEHREAEHHRSETLQRACVQQ